MKVVYTNIFAIDEINGKAILEKIERCARKCYQSLPKGDPEGFVKHIIERGHTSVLEHVQLTFDITTDRGVLAEITRHRHASFSVESTRYCKYDKEMTFVDPIDMFDVPDDEALQAIWKRGCEQTERDYRDMMQMKPAAQVARSVTNQSLKTNLTMSINLRSMRNLFTLRCASGAHPHFKELSIPWLLWMKREIPVVFDDIEYDHEFYEKYKERLDRVIERGHTSVLEHVQLTFDITTDRGVVVSSMFPGALQLMLIPADTTGILSITDVTSYALCEMVVKRKDVEK